MKKQEEIKVSSDVAFWVHEIETYERQFAEWETRGKNITKRYRDERKSSNTTRSKFNVLWSNVQVLSPATYSTPPNPNIDRRFEVKDDLGRYASLVLERAVSYYVKDDNYHKIMKQCVLDRLLPGRGVAWVRYCPVFEESVQVTDDAIDKEAEEVETNLLSEDVATDYVHWPDFGHTWGRTWQEVRGVWRKVYQSRAELVKRFGEKLGNAIPLDAKAKTKNGDSAGEAYSKACIYEIWDKTKKCAKWVHKSMPEVLDYKEDPLGLKNFFPCPEPLYSTLTNDDLIPTPDFALYQDQAIELDTLTTRQALLTKALKVAGVYDGRAQGLERLLNEGAENKLIAVDQWAIFGDKGLAGVISFLPLAEIIGAITAINQAREVVKADIYELTGISDIVRGASVASETATAQQIKGQYANLRLDDRQKDAARFAKDLIVIMTEIIAKHFSLDTIKAVSGVHLLTNMEKEQIAMQKQQADMMAQQAQMNGQPAPQSPEIPEEILELLDMPSWEDVEALIRNDTARQFSIDIETDSTIKSDQEAEKQARTEFLTAVSGFMQQAVAVPPTLAPLAMQLLLFGVRGFKVSRELETTFENVISKMRKEAENPEQPQPNPDEIKAQAEAQRTQAELAIKGRELDMKAQGDAQKTQSDMMMAQVENEIKGRELALKERELSLKERQMMIDAEIESFRINADQLKAKLEIENRSNDKVNENDKSVGLLSQFEAQATATQQALLSLSQAQTNSTNALIATLAQPKKVEIKRDALGQMQSAEVVNG
jgi:hypothetical protein